jgi:hypothetical protein
MVILKLDAVWLPRAENPEKFKDEERRCISAEIISGASDIENGLKHNMFKDILEVYDFKVFGIKNKYLRIYYDFGKIRNGFELEASRIVSKLEQLIDDRI